MLERQYLESRLKHLEQLETGAVAGMNPTSDANLFVSFNKKPSETLRKSYALQILHLNHLSRYKMLFLNVSTYQLTVQYLPEIYLMTVS